MARGEEQRTKVQGSRKDAILDEATRLFAERGYEGTSMADLAERVGLRKASLFHHFASKEQLRRAVLERLVQRVTNALSNANAEVNGGADGFARSLDAVSDAVIELLSQQPYAARLVLREAMEWETGSKDTLSEAFAESLRVGERFVSSAQQSGFCVDGDPKQIIASLMGLHLLPFALGGMMERFTGHAPWSDTFLESRKAAVRSQVRSLLLRK